MSIHRLIDLHELAKQEARRYPLRRFLFGEVFGEEGRHLRGVIGPRGVGKTVMLRQYALERKDAFYLSADSLEADEDPWTMIRQLTEFYGFRIFLLDEVHFLPDPAGVLKRIYDFLEVRIIFTSSVALAFQAFAHDLSRRARLLHLRSFSYREYLSFKEGLELPRLQLHDILERTWAPAHLRAGYRFEEFLRGGMLPFSLEEPEPLPLLRSTLEKVIVSDIPRLLRLAIDELEKIRLLMRFIGRSSVDGINYSSLSRNLGITKYKAEQYVSCLESAFVLQRAFPAGTNVLREPKVLLAPPFRLLYRAYAEALGGLREDFFADCMKQAGLEYAYLKSTRGSKTPDFLIEGEERIVVEVGGKGKGREQFKGIRTGEKLIVAHTELPDAKRVPLFLLGFLA